MYINVLDRLLTFLIFIKNMFKARYLLPDHVPPGRLYIEMGGLEEAFGYKYRIEDVLDSAAGFAIKTIHDNKNKMGSFGFFIGIVGAEMPKKHKLVTLFTYPDFNSCRRKDIIISRHFFKDGYLFAEKAESLREDIVNLLSKESEFRKTTENLEDYMRRFPHLGRLEPKRGFGELYQ